MLTSSLLSAAIIISASFAGSQASAAVGPISFLSPAIACSKLQAKYPEQVSTSESGNKTAEQDVNWSTTCWLPAACFFKPHTTNEVADGLSIITSAGSKFAVRNGGHMPNPGFASIGDSGVLIDLSAMTSLATDDDHNVIYAGTGNKGGDVQRFANQLGLSVVTGVNTMVGISGLTLGGGYPILSGITGLVCDNIVNFEVVLGDSTIINANATANTDLYQALRGGGSNFGIVTRFDMRTRSLHDIWYTIFALDPTDYKTFLPALADTQANMEADPRAGVYMVLSASTVQVALFYSDQTTNPTVLQPMLTLSQSRTLVPPTSGTIYELAQAMSPPEPPLARNTTSIIVRPDANYYIDLYEQLLKTPQSNPDGEIVLALKPVTSHVAGLGTTQTEGVPNSLNVPAEPQTWISALAQWSNVGQTSTFGVALDDITKYASSSAQQDGLLFPNLFANDAGPSQNVLTSYGAASLSNLKEVSTRYDGDQVFQKLLYAGWFVSQA